MAETNDPANASLSGWYKHEETGMVVELINEAEFGTPLTNAYKQAGFVYVGDTDPRPKQVEAKGQDELKQEKGNKK
jgi:hypothetical protein